MTGGGRRAEVGEGPIVEQQAGGRGVAVLSPPPGTLRDTDSPQERPRGSWRWRGTLWPMGPVRDSPLGRGPGQQPVFRGAHSFCLLRSVPVATDKLLVPLRSATRMLRQSGRGYRHRPAVIPSWQEQCGTLSSLFIPQLPRSVSVSVSCLSYSLIYSSVFPFVQSSIIQENQNPLSGILSFPRKNKSWYISFKSTNLIEL